MARLRPERNALRQRLRYEPDTGMFVWVRTGRLAGCRRGDGYVVINVDKTLHYAHRLAFILNTGTAPSVVDHVNGDPSDNRWANLRSATQSQNIANSKTRSEPSKLSKYKGVTFWPARNKWIAKIKVGGVSKTIGYFDDERSAALAYDKRARSTFGEFARLNEEANGNL